MLALLLSLSFLSLQMDLNCTHCLRPGGSRRATISHTIILLGGLKQLFLQLHSPALCSEPGVKGRNQPPDCYRVFLKHFGAGE